MSVTHRHSLYDDHANQRFLFNFQLFNLQTVLCTMWAILWITQQKTGGWRNCKAPKYGNTKKKNTKAPLLEVEKSFMMCKLF